ncbi:antibiotic biosynthesis monooxygenase [Phytoactinopolyspora mesophila]|uniref:ABM domain-containing protein n=1 Tax=Phytoactinopolyspora mesophila TaxID=2650750 RepID=A0A7K3M0P3_9ACTN|nr:antibiotic biosynthesis monooxygenase [Phytoactinopolyspora mesophila]NDL56844.1 hypothetical protein [Phytoactinopolyspora mesophila]
MAVVRTTRFQVDPEVVDEFLRRRAVMIDTLRQAFPGLVQARLARVDERTWVDTWLWESAEHVQAALGGAATIPAVPAAFELVSDAEAEQAEVVDAR